MEFYCAVERTCEEPILETVRDMESMKYFTAKMETTANELNYNCHSFSNLVQRECEQKILILNMLTKKSDSSKQSTKSP